MITVIFTIPGTKFKKHKMEIPNIKWGKEGFLIDKDGNFTLEPVKYFVMPHQIVRMEIH